MATDRQKAAADLINKGVAVEAALVQAGYGPKFAAGNAATILSLFAKLGLLRASKAAPASAPAAKEA